ncbi:MAG: hypothetical protein JRI68_35745 [Deltaproteobacteria bacterium]|nr:hypothetical protein [Deltaproteobacteria bacterium]
MLRAIDGAHGTEVRSMAMGGSVSWPAIGVAACENVVLSQLWIHDNGTIGLMLEDQGGPTSATLADSLIERVGDVGVVVFGAFLAVERSVVRDTSGGPLGLSGRGIDVEPSSGTATRGVTTISQSVLARTGDTSLYLSDADGTVARSVIVDAGAGSPGSGLGRALGVEGNAGRSTCTVSQSLIARAREIGIYGASSDLVVDLTVVRDTVPRDTDQFGGRGINVETAPGGEPPTLVLASSVVDRSVEVGVAIIDGLATIESTLVRDTAASPVAQHYGTGVCVQEDLLAPQPTIPELVLRWSRIDGSHAFGLVTQSASATLEAVWIANTHSIDQSFGDSIAVIDRSGPAWLTLVDSHLEDSARAGLAMFGGTGRLSGTELECNVIHLTGQPHNADFELVDEGGNRCGCAGQQDDCTVLAANLTPPEAMGPAAH